MNGFSMNSPDNKRFRSMMSGGNGAVDQRMLMGGGGWGVGGGAQLLQPYAHQDALMELARENLMLKHQLQAAVIESSQLRLMCEKLQRDADEDSSDACKSSQSRYWSDEEHCRFLEAIQKCGHKDVKSIAAYVGTRNTTQVRTHAQKYFMRLARSSKQGDLQGCRSEKSDKKLDCTNDPSNYMHAQTHNAQHVLVQDARSQSKSAAPLQQSMQQSQHAHHHHHHHQPQQPPQHNHHLQQQMSADGAGFKKRVDAAGVEAVRVEAVKGATSEVLIRVKNRLEAPERPENGGSEEGCSGYSECSQGKQSNADFGQSPPSHAHDSTGFCLAVFIFSFFRSCRLIFLPPPSLFPLF
jgi:SHAQKYF class myb-like DNA-binding protein